MRVFLSGGTGFVGGHVLGALLKRGHRVTVFSRQAGRRAMPQEVDAVSGNLAQAASLKGRLADHDAVVHCVGIIKRRPLQGQTFRRVVERGTANLVAEARRTGIRRFVLQSANGVQPTGTRYQQTKWSAERAVIDAGFDYTIFRPSLIFGADDHLTTLMRRMMRFGLVPYFGSGGYRFAPVHADDVAGAIARSVDLKAAHNRIFHVCGPEVLSYKQILRVIKAVSGSRALVLPMPKLLARFGAFLLGWVPGFPASNEALTMLFEGNLCVEHDWRDVFGVSPTAFTDGIRTYLASSAR